MKKKLYTWSFLALTLLYIILSLGLPSDPKILDKYHLSQSGFHLVSLTLVIPLIMVWLTALYGFTRFQSYTESVADSPEGRPFSQLATGLMVLAFSLPLLSCLSTLTSYVTYKHPHLLPTATILKNYVNLLFPVIAFLLITKGASNLLRTTTQKTIRIKRNWGLFGTILLSSTFIWLITARPRDMSGDTAYFLPNWLIIFTLAIPYLFVWCKGVEAAINLYDYKRKVRGTVYKQAIGGLAKGIATIILLSVSIQLITALAVRLSRLQLSPLLVVVYVLVFLYALGYGWVAIGAQKLKQIEEV